MRIPAWLMQKPTRWEHLRRIPVRRMSILLAAVFLLFSVIGFFIDLMNGGELPHLVVLANAVMSGLNAVVWILVLARLPNFYILLLIAFEFLTGPLNHAISLLLERVFNLTPVPPQTGIHFAAASILIVVVFSYAFFIAYIRTFGKEVYRLQTELDLAHSIQKTLVPIISRHTRAFEIYGVSEPSEKVGGDLVDVVEMRGGDTIAYLADIAGHGLQAGILMGMLKTAARTALLDGADSQRGATLSMLMERLNQVLPGVKEAHMYATFTALRLNLDGESFYGMAASPPLLLWSAAGKKIVRIEEEQFPLALLPVSQFPAHAFVMEPGDLALIATDGILEVCTQGGVEFGMEALDVLLMAGAALPLDQLARSILRAARAYGKQFDDQTLLLVRRHAVANALPLPSLL